MRIAMFHVYVIDIDMTSCIDDYLQFLLEKAHVREIWVKSQLYSMRTKKLGKFTPVYIYLGCDNIKFHMRPTLSNMACNGST